jgi:unsaturated chondroitin disaccharide hydrolase
MSTTQGDLWSKGAALMLERITHTAGAVGDRFPNWAAGSTGQWTTTADGDWTGGAWPGMLWFAHRKTGDERFQAWARQWCDRLRPRVNLQTAFKGFGFYCGAAMGEILSGDAHGKDMALEAAASLRSLFDPVLGLIPLGKDAEEAGEIGKAFSSIDSLQAVPLLLWAHAKTGESSYRECAISHTTRVLDIHCREDGSIIQSSELDAGTGEVARHFTHKGIAPDSVWARAQAWGMLYSAMAFARCPEQSRWLKQSMAAADWWLAHVPADSVAFWDVCDPAIPITERDTAGTAIVTAALLKLGQLAPRAEDRQRYQKAAEDTAAALLRGYLTPTSADDTRPRGMLVGGCFNKRADSRPQDSALNAELIFGSYFLFESLQVLLGNLNPTEI